MTPTAEELALAWLNKHFYDVEKDDITTLAKLLATYAEQVRREAREEIAALQKQIELLEDEIDDMKSDAWNAAIERDLLT